jgi:PAS domain S-box-containing protein
MDVNHRILEWNQGAERLFGYVQDEVVGQGLDRLVAGPDPHMLDQAMAFTRQAFAGQPVPPTETVRYRRDGTPLNVIVGCAPIQTEGELAGVVVVYTDITQRKRIEEALQESESRLRGMLSSMTDHVFAFDSEGRFTFFQTPSTSDLYLPPEAFLGQRHVDVIPSHVSDLFAAAFERNKVGEPAEYEYWMELDGDIRWFSAKLSPRMVDGDFAGSVAVVRNITSRKRMEQRLRERTAQLEALWEITLGMSAQLELSELLHNIVERGCQLLDVGGGSLYLVDEETGSLEQVISHGYKKDHTGTHIAPGQGIAGRVLQRGEPLIVEDYGRLEEQSEEWSDEGLTACLGVPLRRGERVIGTLGFDEIAGPRAFDEQDVWLASLFANQAAIAIENARLYEEVRRQADELRTALDQLRELDRLKSEFIQNVSHELRSPLALIRGYAEMLDMGELGSLTPTQREPVAIIARRARMLSALVEDITLILGAEVNPPQPEPVSLDELARAAVEDFQISAADAELTLETEIASGLSPVRGTPTHLRRVLDNLVNNAIKFTPPQGTVTVRVRQPQEDHVLLEVSDTGIGIHPEQQDRIFERFYQVDGSTKRRYPGTGLGLALVKEIVETYGGAISLESEVDVGSTFAIRLPVFRRGGS